MASSYFLRIVALVPLILSGVVVSKATQYFNGGLHFSSGNSATYRNWMLPKRYFNKQKPYTTYKSWRNQLGFNNHYPWLLLPPGGRTDKDKSLGIVEYQAEDSIIFDATKNILSLHGASKLSYKHMQLEANLVDLHLNTNTIHAQGTKDLRNKSIGNPIFTYKDVAKNKYGKEGAAQTRIFFMEKIRYNIDTKRALVYKLLTKQDESIIKSKQVKKEDEETFYAQDIMYTTCALAHPHFYIYTKRAKMVQDQQITTGPFRFYFNNTPTPLRWVFGALFLEGKRTYGIIPPEIGESESGFYLRNGGYYINFNDYADISILGSVYSNGATELKNDLRYKKRYLCSGNLHYGIKRTETNKGWSLKWEHKTLMHGPRSFNAKVDLYNTDHYNESYNKILNDEDKNILQNIERQSGLSLSYRNQLIGFPYALTLQVEYKHDLKSNFKDWTLPKGSLTTASWYPFRRIGSRANNYWFHNIQLKHCIDFENHLQNAKKQPKSFSIAKAVPIPKTHPWNHYLESGIKHTIPLNMSCKIFDVINLEPHLSYTEGWYWLYEDIKGPIQVPGFNRVHSWNFGAGLSTTLYQTHYFQSGTWLQGFRIKMEPSLDFTYTPNTSEKYFQLGKKQEKKYAFKGLRPAITLANRATSVLTCKIHNTVELKVKKETEETEETEKKQTSRKIYLLKNLDLEAKYDFKAPSCHLVEGIHLHLASQATMGKIGKIGFDLTTTFDPYMLSNPTLDPDTAKMKIRQTNRFAWNYGHYLGTIKNARFKVNMDFTYDSNQKKKRKKDLLKDNDYLTSKTQEHKIDFQEPWNFGWEFNWIYKKLYEYEEHKPGYTTEKYVTFNGSITLVKKWKVTLHSTYDFTKHKLDPSATDISIQRDLHCWQLSYKWHPLAQPSKYDFSLGVKANVLKVLKLPRKRSYNTLE